MRVPTMAAELQLQQLRRPLCPRIKAATRLKEEAEDEQPAAANGQLRQAR